MVHMFSRFFVGLARLTWNADGFLGVRVLCARSELQLVGVELFFGQEINYRLVLALPFPR